MRQSFITILLPIATASSDAIKSALSDGWEGADSGVRKKLESIQGLHFASASVLDLDTPEILIEISADGSASHALAEFCAALEVEMRELAQMIGHPQNNLDALTAFVARHMVPVGLGWGARGGLNFQGSPEMMASRIVSEQAAAHLAAEFVASDLPRADAPLAALSRIRSHLWSKGRKSAFVPLPAPIVNGKAGPQTAFIPSVWPTIGKAYTWLAVGIAVACLGVLLLWKGPALAGPTAWILLATGAASTLMIWPSSWRLSRRFAFSASSALALLAWNIGPVAAICGAVAAILIGLATALLTPFAGAWIWPRVKGSVVPAAVVLVATLALVGALAGPWAVMWLFLGVSVAVALSAPLIRSLIVEFLWPAVAVGLAALVLGWWYEGPFLAFAALGVAALVQLAAAFGLYVQFRRLENTDVPGTAVPQKSAMEAVLRQESKYKLNHLFAVSRIKNGWLRRLTLRLGFKFAETIALYFSSPGRLANLGTIHFARWFVHKGEVVFLSNYDGSWESYLEDFVQRAHQGVTGVWSNTEEFPRSANLISGGATDSDRFRLWARRQQRPTLFWYCAYPSVPMSRVRANAAICQGLAGAGDDAAAAAWLENFGYPASSSTLETHNIQSLAFGGLSSLAEGAALVVRFGSSPRTWLERANARLSFGESVKPEVAVTLALTADGLRKAGLDDATLAKFPVIFQDGMTVPWRARALGDVGRNAPEHWRWGQPPVDALLLIYARDQEVLAAELATWKNLSRTDGHEAREIKLQTLPKEKDKRREPFGFVDGVSQPLMKGTRRARRVFGDHNIVADGEFILGYADNTGFMPPSPVIPLPGGAAVDFGRNGTFLAVRELEQDVPAFDAYLESAGKDLTPRLAAMGVKVPAAEWIGAKMVGRWKDGTSLVRFPEAPGTWFSEIGARTRAAGDPPPGERARPDNDFLFGRDDPKGARCPFGAHVRRANPRESFDPGSEAQLEVTNRHRIFRVGRPIQPEGENKPGLLFMCLNADLERQFEFIQHTWLLGSTFHELADEVDPIMGAGDRGMTVPSPDGPVFLRGMTDFVTVKGGGYFFIPGRAAIGYLLSRM